MNDFSNFSSNSIGALWIAVHLVGLLAAWMVRLDARRRFAILMQGSFLAALLAVALATIAGHVCCFEMWPLSALTLAVMIVIAIVDLGVPEASTIPMEG